MKSTSEEVLRLVAEDRELRNGSSSKLAEVIETRIVPHFDMNRMTRLAVGKNWHKATIEQQKTLINEFRALLVRSYAAAYTAYRQVTVEVAQLTMTGKEDDVTVKTKILLPGGAPPLPVDYAMGLTKNGWKVYNVVVDGASLVTTYRNDFTARIQSGGIEGLIDYLKESNAKAVAAARK
ncbi:MAG: ABC transporter substrate-binding protein [Betaproteobacteria bacterium]